MKTQILLLLFFFQLTAVPQYFIVEQITNGDFDIRNPFIYKNSDGLNRELFFELHKDGYSNNVSIFFSSFFAAIIIDSFNEDL